ncbi:MAG TPA: outer membrane lipoprotein-sorting protein [Candidatus Sulfotelmatobacter sp.]|nr:outer membrane lipoprotein-sorting protein [Candidatus Sulfotelmatobacter sp.]
MKTYLSIAALSAQVLIVMGSWHPAPVQAAGTSVPAHNLLSTEEIVERLVQRNLERARALTAYEGSRVYRLEYHGFPSARSAEMIVDVKYRSPGTKEFTIRSETGSRLIIDRVFHKLLQSEKEALTEENQAHVALNTENYRFTLIGFETTLTDSCYVLSVEPRTKDKLLYRGQIWVDAQDFAVVRIEATPAKNPSFWTKETKIKQHYGKVGDFWLPVSNESSSVIRLGGQADLTIDYRDYQITSADPAFVTNTVAGRR